MHGGAQHQLECVRGIMAIVTCCSMCRRISPTGHVLWYFRILRLLPVLQEAPWRLLLAWLLVFARGRSRASLCIDTVMMLENHVLGCWTLMCVLLAAAM